MLEAAAALGEKGMAPFYTLLDGGKHSKFYKVSSRFFFQGLFRMFAKCIVIFISSSSLHTVLCKIGCHHSSFSGILKCSQGSQNIHYLTCILGLLQAGHSFKRRWFIIYIFSMILVIFVFRIWKIFSTTAKCVIKALTRWRNDKYLLQFPCLRFPFWWEL